ncbi:hypothetical protein ABFS82_05G027400 [Erythranthe guttata]
MLSLSFKLFFLFLVGPLSLLSLSVKKPAPQRTKRKTQRGKKKLYNNILLHARQCLFD